MTVYVYSTTTCHSPDYRNRLSIAQKVENYADGNETFTDRKRFPFPENGGNVLTPVVVTSIFLCSLDRPPPVQH